MKDHYFTFQNVRVRFNNDSSGYAMKALVEHCVHKPFEELSLYIGMLIGLVACLNVESTPPYHEVKLAAMKNFNELMKVNFIPLLVHYETYANEIDSPPDKTMICWVCGRKLGPRYGELTQAHTCAVVKDGGGTEHRVHHVCARDADGKKVRDEKVLP